MSTATASTTTGIPATPLQDPAILAARCALHLQTIARIGGPESAIHLEAIRRHLVRRERRAALGRRRQIAHAVAAAGRGRPGAVTDEDRPALIADLRAIEHALAVAARVGSAHEVGRQSPVRPTCI